jgi:hypothetical protein
MNKIYPPLYAATFFAALLILSCTITWAQWVAPVYPPAGGFHIDGNLQANIPTPGNGDWIPDSVGGGGYVMSISGVLVNSLTTYHIVDSFNGGDDIMTSGYFNDNPTTDWTWTNGSPINDKTDLNNVLLHFANDSTGSGCNKWMLFAADRDTNTGISYVDFEFLQDSLIKNPGGTFTAQGPHGGRRVNDLLFSIDYPGVGGQTNFVFYKWDTISPGVYDYVPFTPITNIPPWFNPPYGFTSAGGEPVPYGAFGNTAYAGNQFVEGAVDLDAATHSYISSYDSIVFKTLTVKTKVSTSPSASLADMIEPIQLNNLTINCLTGIEEYDLTGGFSIYPNPAGNMITVQINNPLITINNRLEIYNLPGEKVYHSSLENTQHKMIDISALASGIYSVHLVTERGRAVKKLVKQ